MDTLAHFPRQQRVVARLRRAIEQGRVAHAYLFCGNRLADTYGVGLALARALNCDANRFGCGDCGVCTRIAEANHPDVITLLPEGTSNTIPIATIRNQVIARLGGAPMREKVACF